MYLYLKKKITVDNNLKNFKYGQILLVKVSQVHPLTS